MKKINGLIDSFTTITQALGVKPGSSNMSMRTMAYSQAAVDSAIIIQGSQSGKHALAMFAFILPMLVIFGFLIGSFSAERLSNPRQTSIGIVVFLGLTLLNSVFLFLYFFSFSWISALFFLAGVITSIFLISKTLKIYFKDNFND